ncbi:MAG: sensor histidine kinase [Ferruginibacter sp.]
MANGKIYTTLLHITGWLLFLSVPFIFIFSQSIEGNARFLSGDPLNFLGFTIYIAIFYFHTYLLFPKLYFRKRRLLYFLSIAVLLTVVFFFRPFDRLSNQNRSRGNDDLERPGPLPHTQYRPPPIGQGRLPPGGGPGNKPPRFGSPANNSRMVPRVDIISIELFILVIAISIALILGKRWRLAVQEASRAEADKANAELSFLKAQINPHFLFNTLNNIYSLALTKNENVADSIMKLSNIMRYVTDDVNEDFVSLEKELDSIGDYISLQRLRLGKKAAIDFIIEGDISGKVIAPLILMPFVENAFKHGISNAAESNILIKLTATQNQIVFYTGNKLFATPRNTERTGIGNTNTKKRLAQVYPEKHLLDIASQNGLFTVHLVMYI